MAETASTEPPYGAEYAKSNRSSCKGCKDPIPKDSLRMSVRTPSRHFDGLQDNWFHFECFWKRAKAETLFEGNVRNLESLKWDDQEKVRKRIIEVKETAVEAPTPKSHIPKAEIAKSGAGKCFECKEKILKGELRIQLKASNFHPDCIKKLKAITGGVDTISGYENLDEKNKKVLDDLFGASKRKAESDDVVEGTPRKKVKTEGISEDEKLMTRLKKQSDILWQVRKDLAAHLSKEEIDMILTSNNRYRRKRDGPDVTIEHLADCIVFGVPQHCPDCDNVIFYSSSQHTYKCAGYISEYTKCPYANRNPLRNEMRFPTTVMSNNEWLQDHTFPGLAKRRYAPGSEIITSVDTPNPIDNIKKRKVTESETKSKKPTFVKNGVAIDGNCEAGEFAHVFIDVQKVVWQATLGHTDIASNRNSYYKIQLLKHDHDEKYYVFRSWGRIGTDQGGFKTEHFDDDLSAAKKNFETLFRDKTKNEWSQRDSFQKQPGMMDMIDLEVDKSSEPSIKFDVDKSTSKLARPIREVIATIFDVNVINDTLKSMDLDMDKLPLGKLSRNHIMSAYRVLKELSGMFAHGAPSSGILDASNRFYTLIPHDSGHAAPPLLNTIELVREKTSLLDDLLEIEVAYSLIKQESIEEAESDHQIDPIDAHYRRLRCGLEVLDKKSLDFLLVKDYVAKTHAPTHSDYTLTVREVFSVDRYGETTAFKRNIGNVHLLWHGSRTSNYAGILSQGLRVAPPEAPANGYMFGKGIYFADMVSKSANYCFAHGDGDGFLMLCEVALGDIQTEIHANEGLKKPKRGKNSVKGIGQIHPDEATKQVLADGTTIPIGKPKKSNKSGVSLQYNEYIVYDEAQVRIKYLVRVKFDYQGRH